MSAINDALHRAEQGREGTQKNVVPVPRSGAPNPFLQVFAFLAVLAAVVLFGLRLMDEQRQREISDLALSRSLQDLSSRQDDIEKLIRSADSSIDIRLQLEVMEMKNDLKALSSRLDSRALEDQRTFSDEALSLRREMKGELVVVSRRLHDVERNHSILSDRIDGLRSDLPSAGPEAESR